MDFFPVNWKVVHNSAENNDVIGIIIQDHLRWVPAALSQSGKAMSDTQENKTCAAVSALNFARDVGIQDIVLEGDIFQLSSALWQNQLISHASLSEGHVIKDARQLLRSYRRWQISYIHRQCNVSAWELAKYARTVVDFRVWLEETPAFLLEAVIKEVIHPS